MSPGEVLGQPLASGHPACQHFLWYLVTLYSVVLMAQSRQCPRHGSAGHLGPESTTGAVGQLSDLALLCCGSHTVRTPVASSQVPRHNVGERCWGFRVTLGLWPLLRALAQAGLWEALQTWGPQLTFPTASPAPPPQAGSQLCSQLSICLP